MGKSADKTFRDAVRDVRPLPVRDPPPAPPRPAAIARFSRAETADVLRESLAMPEDPALLESADELAFARSGFSQEVLRRLRRGRFAIQAEIDLHGLGRQAAHEVLRRFIVESAARQLRCVRVIHGKGRRSGPGGPVIKHVVNHWLRRMQEVGAFASARPADGGTGAVYVLLARPRPQAKPA